MPKIRKNVGEVAKYIGVAKSKRQHLQGLNAKGFRRPKMIVNGVTITAAEHGAGYGYSMLEGGGKPFYFWAGQPLEGGDAEQYAMYIRTTDNKLEYKEDEDNEVISPKLKRVLNRGDINEDTYISPGEVIPYEKGAVILPSQRYAVTDARFFAPDKDTAIERAKNRLPAPWVIPLSGQPKRGPDGMNLTGAVIIGRTLYGVSVDNRYIIWKVGSDEFREEAIPISDDYLCCWRVNQYGDSLIGIEIVASPRRRAAELSGGESTEFVDRYFSVDVSYDAEEDTYSFNNFNQTNTSGIDMYAVDFNYNAPRNPQTGRVENVPVVAAMTIYSEQAVKGDSPTYDGDEPGEEAPTRRNILVMFDIYSGGFRVGGYVAMRQDGGVWNGHLVQPAHYYNVEYIAELRDLDLRYLMYSHADRYYDPGTGDSSLRTIVQQDPPTVFTGYQLVDNSFSPPSDAPAASQDTDFNRFRRYVCRFGRGGSICVNPDLNVQQMTAFIRPYWGNAIYALDVITGPGDQLMPVNHEDIYNDRPEDASYPEYPGPPENSFGPWAAAFDQNELVDVAGFGGIDGYTPHDTITS